MIGRGQCLPGPGTIFRSDLARILGGRRSKWRFVGDYDFWLRLSREGKIVHRPEILAQWRYHADSTSVNMRGPAMAFERIKVIEEFLEQNIVPKKIARMALGNSYYIAARLAFFNSQVPGRKYILKAFLMRRGWVEESKIHVSIYILLLPLSASIYKQIIKLFPIKGNLN